MTLTEPEHTYLAKHWQGAITPRASIGLSKTQKKVFDVSRSRCHSYDCTLTETRIVIKWFLSGKIGKHEDPSETIDLSTLH